jgi:hypothetical protein
MQQGGGPRAWHWVRGGGGGQPPRRACGTRRRTREGQGWRAGARAGARAAGALGSLGAGEAGRGRRSGRLGAVGMGPRAPRLRAAPRTGGSGAPRVCTWWVWGESRGGGGAGVGGGWGARGRGVNGGEGGGSGGGGGGRRSAAAFNLTEMSDRRMWGAARGRPRPPRAAAARCRAGRLAPRGAGGDAPRVPRGWASWHGRCEWVGLGRSGAMQVIAAGGTSAPARTQSAGVGCFAGIGVCQRWGACAGGCQNGEGGTGALRQPVAVCVRWRRGQRGAQPPRARAAGWGPGPRAGTPGVRGRPRGPAGRRRAGARAGGREPPRPAGARWGPRCRRRRRRPRRRGAVGPGRGGAPSAAKAVGRKLLLHARRLARREGVHARVRAVVLWGAGGGGAGAGAGLGGGEG